MLTVDDYVQKYVDRSNQLLAYKMALDLWDMLVVLEKKGYVREQLRGQRAFERRELLISISQNADKTLDSLNKFHLIYSQPEKNLPFFDMMLKNGLKEDNMFHIINVQLIFNYLLNTESFKNLLQFMLQGINPRSTLGMLFDILKKTTKDKGEAKKVTDRININLRNGFAHFLFREEKDLIFYYKQKQKEGCWFPEEFHIQSGELLQKIREVSLMRVILACILVDWYMPITKGKNRIQSEL